MTPRGVDPAALRADLCDHCECTHNVCECYRPPEARSQIARVAEKRRVQINALRQLVAAMESERALRTATPPDDPSEKAAEAIRAALDDAGAPRDLGPQMGDGWWDGCARRIAAMGRRLRAREATR